MRAKTPLLALWTVLGAAHAHAAAPVPEAQIPPAVLGQLDRLESQFEAALAQDCAPDRCFPKGCTYVAHVVADKPRTGSLPGLGEERGPGSVTPQEYLTQARCELAHERSISPKDVQALVARLSQKLSRGWLVVTVAPQGLPPVPAELKQPKVEEPPAPVPPLAAEKPVLPPPSWDGAVAARELWVSLLPHFAWMIALLLGTVAALVLIWAARRVGRESFEEKAMLAQLAQGHGNGLHGEVEPPAPVLEPEPTDGPRSLLERGDESEFVAKEKQAWLDRLASGHREQAETVVRDLLREWLRAGEYALLAKAIFVFEDHLSLDFPGDGELATRKIELADYVRTVDPARLPSDAEFFRALSQHAVASSLLAQEDAGVYRSLREELGSMGIARLIEALPPRQGALLFALVPVDVQHEVARILPLQLKRRVCEQLLLSNRISREETAYVFHALRAAFAGEVLPSNGVPEVVADRGREFDAAGALSVLLPHVPPRERSGLFAAALERSSGSFPLWYEDIVFADMLSRIPAPIATELLLDVDIRCLAGWFSLQDPGWQERFVAALTPTMRHALRSGMAFGSRSDQLTLAKRGQRELAAALKKLVARGQLSFAEVLG
jgi:hypothetical protein